jgi:hypothetical protein
MSIASVVYTENNNNITAIGTDGRPYCIPANDQEAYNRFGVQEWIDAGNTIEPYVEPEPHWIDKRLANTENGGYGSIGEQLDMLYWDKKNGTDNWEKHIDKVKSDIPKE